MKSRMKISLEEFNKILKLRTEGLGITRIGREINRSKYSIRRIVDTERIPRYLKPKPLKLPLQILTEKYLAEIGSTSTKTLSTYLLSASFVDKYCLLNNYKLPDLKREDLVNILNAISSKNFKAQVLKNIKVIFGWAYRVQYLPSNPTETIKIKPPKAVTKPKTIHLADIKKIIEAASDPMDKLVVQALAYTGLRLHEVLAIRLNNIDLPGRTIRIDRAKMDKVFLKVIPESLVHAITDYLAANPAQGQYLLSRQDGTYPSSALMFNRLKVLMHKVCPGKRITSHMFRHTYASLAAKNIQSTVIGRQALSESMGWSNDKMFNTYMHVGEDQAEIREMITKMEESWSVLEEVV